MPTTRTPRFGASSSPPSSPHSRSLSYTPEKSPPPPAHPFPPSSAHHGPYATLSPARWEDSGDEPNASDSLPPRMRLKEKRKPFGEFRVIREPAPASSDPSPELLPIPSPPWASDSYNSHRLYDETRGRAPSHGRPSVSANATAGPSRELCTHSRDDSRSSNDYPTTGAQSLSVPSSYAWPHSSSSRPVHSASSTSSSRLPPGPSMMSASTSSASASMGSYPASPHPVDDGYSDTSSMGRPYQLKPARTAKPRTRLSRPLVPRPPSVVDGDELDDDEGEVDGLDPQNQDQSGMETNTFAAPARPSRKQKRYPCDVCGHVFTRSGDVRRHKESRHDNTEGCRCPYCDRVLTRQDALQRHWDKYCRKKSKRHLDRQAAQEARMGTDPNAPPGSQGQMYRYHNLFG
ncbi:hypothetical protein B0H34DRAFT_719471 [Crassisporium funariophilum]|nr:hypothetical protein B0H34DRAFT_719471 [Crassisporium funariophilum]